MFHVHFSLQCFEVIGEISLDFTTHPLSCPLLEAIELFIDVHLG
jgi:hypothetical protein